MRTISIIFIFITFASLVCASVEIGESSSGVPAVLIGESLNYCYLDQDNVFTGDNHFTGNTTIDNLILINVSGISYINNSNYSNSSDNWDNLDTPADISLTDIPNNAGYYNSCDNTSSCGYLTSYTETDPLWSSNYSLVGFLNTDVVFYDVLPNVTLTYDLGSPVYRWNNTYTGYLSADDGQFSGDLEVFGTINADIINASIFNVTNMTIKNMWVVNTVATGNVTANLYCDNNGNCYNLTILDTNASNCANGEYLDGDGSCINFNNTVNTLTEGNSSIWNRTGTTITPANAGDDITTTGTGRFDGGIGIGADPTSQIIFSAKKDQSGPTDFLMENNDNDGAARFTFGDNAGYRAAFGVYNQNYAEVAWRRAAVFSSDSGLTGGMAFKINGPMVIALRDRTAGVSPPHFTIEKYTGADYLKMDYDGDFDFMAGDITTTGTVTATALNITENVVIGGNFSAKIPYGTFSSNESQVATVADTVYTMNFSHVEDNYSMVLENNENITVLQSGNYHITLSGIFVTDTNNKHFEIFPQTTHGDGVTMVNVPRSNTLLEVENAGTHGLISVSFILDLNAGDKFRIMYSSDDAGSMTVWTAGHGTGANAVPETPSMIMSIVKISEITD